MQARDRYFKLAALAAQRHYVDAEFLQALLLFWSGLDPLCIRSSVGAKLCYAREFADKAQIPYEVECQYQTSSLGLSQLLGRHAREMDFHGDLPELLSNPELNVEYAARRLQILSQSFGYEGDIISAWHTGQCKRTVGGFYQNETTVDGFFKVLRGLQKLR